MTSQRAPFTMTLSLNVLNHLGINLYSNVPAVLSEVVANAWDADATQVLITFEKDAGRITIVDDGAGMTRAEINDHFLKVGYQRRMEQSGNTLKFARAPMGRKGIGKLSLFSVADVIDVFSAKENEKSGLRMSRSKIEAAIRESDVGQYRPDEIAADDLEFDHGTKIVLSDLRRRQSMSTVEFLRRRVARRFSIIGPQHNFEVLVNGDKITPEDRGYHSNIQYLWLYGDTGDHATQFSCLARPAEQRQKNTGDEDIAITGWLGTVSEVGQLKDAESSDNLNRIAVFVRGKMAQEDILGDFSERGVYASYLIGEIQVDGLDTDDKEDSATSSRQNIVEDDPRYNALKNILANELKYIESKWSEWRTDDGARKAMEIPELNEWMEKLLPKQRNGAKGWLGRIYRLRTNTPEERKQLLKHAVFAFEFYRANDNLGALEKIDDSNLDALLGIINELDSLETNLYGQIVQQRVAVIRTLQEKVDANEKERVIQELLFDHLWLLDPHWERVEASEMMEKRIDALFEEIDGELTEEEKLGRLDIGYRKSAGIHIIVELKRPERIVSLSETVKQIQKYFIGLSKVLAMQGSNEPVEIVLLLGKSPAGWDSPGEKERFIDVLKPYNARIVFYDELLENAYRAYDDYIQRKGDYDRLQAVIQAIDDFQVEE